MIIFEFSLNNIEHLINSIGRLINCLHNIKNYLKLKCEIQKSNYFQLTFYSKKIISILRLFRIYMSLLPSLSADTLSAYPKMTLTSQYFSTMQELIRTILLRISVLSDELTWKSFEELFLCPQVKYIVALIKKIKDEKSSIASVSQLLRSKSILV